MSLGGLNWDFVRTDCLTCSIGPIGGELWELWKDGLASGCFQFHRSNTGWKGESSDHIDKTFIL